MAGGSRTKAGSKAPTLGGGKPDCRRCTRFEAGPSDGPFHDYVRCVLDEMGRRTDVDLDVPDALGREALVADQSRRKGGGTMPDWIRKDAADYASALDCEQFHLREPEKPKPVEMDIETWLDAAEAFTMKTGLALGTPPRNEDGQPHPGLIPWEGCCDQLRSVFQDGSFISALFNLQPFIRFVGADERRDARENIDALKDAVRAFIHEMALPGRVGSPFPEVHTAADVAAFFEPTRVEPGTPEAERFWDEVIASGEPVVTGPDAWIPSAGLFEAFATILTLESPQNEDHRPTDQKTVARGFIVLLLRNKARKSNGQRLSFFDIALLVAALDMDFGPPTTLPKLAQRIRGFQAAAIREAKKLTKTEPPSIPITR